MRAIGKPRLSADEVAIRYAQAMLAGDADSVTRMTDDAALDAALALVARFAEADEGEAREGRDHHQLPLADLSDETSEQANPFGRLICVPRQGTSPGELRDTLLDVYGVYTTMRVALPQPLPVLIRRWVQANAREDLPASLAALERAIPVPAS